MAPTELDGVRHSISVTLAEIRAGEAAFAAQGLDVSDYFDRAEARDILNRIERRLLAQEAAE